jgi:hypothetical protein
MDYPPLFGVIFHGVHNHVYIHVRSLGFPLETCIENQALCEYVVHLETNQVSISLGCVSTTQPKPKESQISLLDKIDGIHSKF